MANVANSKAYHEMKPVNELALEQGEPLKEVIVAEATPSYFEKMLGAGEEPPPQLSLYYSSFSFLGAFVGMSAIGLLHTYVMMPEANMALLVGSFGAMSVILFSGFKTPVAQPKNVIIGNTIGGLVGVVVFESMALLGLQQMLWLGAALAVSLTIVAQEITGTVHPPGGATALIYVITPPVQHLRYWFVLCPSFLGAVIMVAVACVTNNLSSDRVYPQYWWPSAEEAESEESEPETLLGRYFKKFQGAKAKPLPAAFPPLAQTWCSFLGAFVGVATLGLLHAYVIIPMMHETLLIGAFGAMSVIIFSAWKVPFAQPKNAIIGNTLGGLVGVCVYNFLQAFGLGQHVWFGAALAVALTILVQEITNTVHPPGGATALLFEIVPMLHKFEFMYVLTPSFLGTVILVLIGCITNNLVAKRHYPQFWFPF
ncbi:unnamed protein product [Durusdinium trenchii]|uniref:HPP transmembrane region domain-containing protein n=1 Tax=Durusdinium trenchii TaxID=1381693 RepID=A0ABP0M6G9_9DINO|eukprot:g13363.t1